MGNPPNDIGQIEVTLLKRQETGLKAAKVEQLLDHREHPLGLIRHAAEHVDLRGPSRTFGPFK